MPIVYQGMGRGCIVSRMGAGLQGQNSIPERAYPMSDATEHDQINAAIVRFISSYWSTEAGQQIESVYGKEVAVNAKAVYDAAMGCPVDWQTATMDSALGILSDFLTAQYRWLSQEARTRLNYCYIMTWK